MAQHKRRSGAQDISTVMAADDLQIFGDDGIVTARRTAWCISPRAPGLAAEPERMYVKCVIQPGSTATELKVTQVDPPEPDNQIFVVNLKQLFDDNATVDPLKCRDIGALPAVSAAAVLEFLKIRYEAKNIYTLADPLLVAINPYKNLNNAGIDYIEKYRDVKDVMTLSPHVFTIGRQAMDNLSFNQKSQTITVSGESGSGKTEATKQLMRYFAAGSDAKGDIARIQKMFLAANPVLEAFGNAKTIHNYNSSRFGRFMQLNMERSGGITGNVKNFLLEKSRILTQDGDERSYHIFYQLIRGAADSTKRLLTLGEIGDYNYLNKTCTEIPGGDDAKDFREVDESLTMIGLSTDEKLTVYSVLSGILALGNLKLSSTTKGEFTEAAIIDPAHPNGSSLFSKLCALLFLDPVSLEKSLLSTTSKAGNETFTKFHRMNEARIFVDSLAKGMYEGLFFWIVNRLNSNVAPVGGNFDRFIGMLDIFGFEIFPNNSLEQLFINIANEWLQKHFVDVVFKKEYELYKKEGLANVKLQWTTNDDVIELLVGTGRAGSIMGCLGVQCAVGENDKAFVSDVANLKHPKCQRAKVDGAYRFEVIHTVGSISYNANGFVFKNQDHLPAPLMTVIQTSDNSVVSEMYKGVVVPPGKLPKDRLIGSQFQVSLESMMATIDKTEVHFIRCVRPNEDKAALKFTNNVVFDQLISLSVLEALQLRDLGFSFRRPFAEFVEQCKYTFFGICADDKLTDKEKCEKIWKAVGVPDTEWKNGNSLVFATKEAMTKLRMAHTEALSKWGKLVPTVEAMYLASSRKQKVEENEPNLVRLQAHCRKVLANTRMRKSYTSLI